jgi:hypothetical protein
MTSSTGFIPEPVLESEREGCFGNGGGHRVQGIPCVRLLGQANRDVLAVRKLFGPHRGHSDNMISVVPSERESIAVDRLDMLVVHVRMPGRNARADYASHGSGSDDGDVDGGFWHVPSKEMRGGRQYRHRPPELFIGGVVRSGYIEIRDRFMLVGRELSPY